MSEESFSVSIAAPDDGPAGRVAASLGRVVGRSRTTRADGREVAFALDVEPEDGSADWIVAGCPEHAIVVVTRVEGDRALDGMRLGKALVALLPEMLADGKLVRVAVGSERVIMRFTARDGDPSVLLAERAGLPATSLLVGRLRRLHRLEELFAPDVILASERQLVREAHAALGAGDHDLAALPPELADLLASVVEGG